jgi:hypothetical protein
MYATETLSYLNTYISFSGAPFISDVGNALVSEKNVMINHGLNCRGEIASLTMG